MNGYMLHHEAEIKRQAAAMENLAGEYWGIISDAEALLRMPGWDSPAAEAKRAEIQKILDEAKASARSLTQIGDDLYAFTESHKTWLEDIVEEIKEMIT